MSFRDDVAMDIRRGIVELLKRTSSLCPVCMRGVAAEVVQRGGKVYLLKSCEEHGRFEVLVNSDRGMYYDSRGAGSAVGSCCGGGGCGPGAGRVGDGHDPGLIEKTQTCIALIEIVESCNLKCPTCFADSPFREAGAEACLSLDEVRRRVGAVLDRKGVIDVLQLSGGEPTIHPRFFDVLEWVLTEERIGYTLLNTNGVLLAGDRGFMERLGQMRRRYGKFEVYLQYDGPQEAGQVRLRGADLRSMRERAVAGCEEQGVAVTLAMTVSEENFGFMGQAVRWGLDRRGVRGITFQPAFHSGRTGAAGVGVGLTVEGEACAGGVGGGAVEGGPLHGDVGGVVAGLIGQMGGVLGERDFTPLPCGDPNCHTIGYLLRRGGQVSGVSRHVDFSMLQGFLKDRLDFRLEDLARCGCESEPLGHVLKGLEVGVDDVFRLFIKPFMDAWTYDQDRIDRCCVHVVLEGGRLESFCRHYALRGGG